MRRFLGLLMLVSVATVAAGCSRYVKSVTSAQKHAKVVAAKALLSTVRQALERYHNDLGVYPTAEQGLDALTDKPKFEDERLGMNWRGPYIEKPTDPWGHPLVYQPPDEAGAGGGRYKLFSKGPDGQEDTADDISMGPGG